MVEWTGRQLRISSSLACGRGHAHLRQLADDLGMEPQTVQSAEQMWVQPQQQSTSLQGCQ